MYYYASSANLLELNEHLKSVIVMYISEIQYQLPIV